MSCCRNTHKEWTFVEYRWNHHPRNLSLANMLKSTEMYRTIIRYIFFVFELAKAFRLARLGLGSKQKLQTNFHCNEFQLTWTGLCSKREVHAGFYVRYSPHLKLENAPKQTDKPPEPSSCFICPEI